MSEAEAQKEVKPLDPSKVRSEFGSLKRGVTRLQARLSGTDEIAKRAQRLARSAERRADESRLDAHAAECQAKVIKLDNEGVWRILNKALEDIIALRGRVKELEDANQQTAGRGDAGGDGGAGDRHG